MPSTRWRWSAPSVAGRRDSGNTADADPRGARARRFQKRDRRYGSTVPRRACRRSVLRRCLCLSKSPSHRNQNLGLRRSRVLAVPPPAVEGQVQLVAGSNGWPQRVGRGASTRRSAVCRRPRWRGCGARLALGCSTRPGARPRAAGLSGRSTWRRENRTRRSFLGSTNSAIYDRRGM